MAVEIPEFTLGDALTEAQLQFFSDHGFIRFRGVATDREVDELISSLESLQRDFIEEGRKKVLGIPLRFGTASTGEPFIQRFAFASHYNQAIHRFVSDARFEPVRRLCGENARLAENEKDGVVVNHFINQTGSSWRKLGWHTDGLRDLFFLTMPEPMLNVGLYLDDCPKEKGGVRLLAGTHTQGMWSMMFRKFYFMDHREDPDEVCLETRRGDLTIHDGRLWHRTAHAEVEGDASRRRTMYMAYVDGPERPRSEDSGMPLYHRLQGLAG